MTLRGRLALVNALVLLLALLLLAAIILNQLVHDLHEQLDYSLALLGTQELARVELVDSQPVFGANLPQAAPQAELVSFVRLLNNAGQITAGQGPYNSIPVLASTLQVPPQGAVANQISPDGTVLRVYTRPILAENRPVGYLQVGANQDELQETLETVYRSLWIGIPLTLLISGLLSLWTARQALNPLTRMTRSAAAISADNLAERLPVPQAKDEVQALALAFNATLDRLAATFARQRRFTADASHELRTPITAILGQAEFALNRPRTTEIYQKTLKHIRQEAERMQRLIGRMLTLARVETGQQPLDLAPTDITPLIQTLVNTLRPRAAAKGLELKATLPDTLTIITDADSLTQILLNLLENSLTYTAQGQVAVTVTTSSDDIQIAIDDTGPGIAPEHLPYLFEPFYRADPSRSQNQGHVGLGLALAYELSQLIGGSIAVTNRPQSGTRFILSLPLRPAMAWRSVNYALPG